MDDLISRQAAIDAIENAFDRETILNRFVRKIAISAVRMLPSAQPERGKGRWLNVNESEKWECSKCSRIMWFSPRLGVKPSDYRFCPNCGADMREEQE